MSHYDDMWDQEGELMKFDAAKTQPLPTISSGSRVIDLVAEDLIQRAKVGKKKYGCYLYAENGREALLDAYQEALDLCMYLRQLIQEERVKGK